MEGKQLNPIKALKAGLVDAVVAQEDLISSAKTWLRTDATSSQAWDKKGASIPGGSPADPKLKQMFMVATAMFQEKTFGNYPAGAAILSCLYEGLSSPFDVGLKIETRYFVSLLTGKVAPNMVRTLFLSLQEANKLIRRPAGVPKAEFKKIGVLGAGLMGAGIANTSAKNGIDVVLIDREQSLADKGKAHAANLMDRSIAKGRATEEKKEALLARISPTTNYEALADCDLVIEAVFEDRKVKADVTQRAETTLSSEALFASNTSTLPITGLAAASSRPENFIGLHFFSPVEKMPLIEVIRGEKTSDACLAKVLDFVRQINKTPIVVNDSRGFYTSRVFGTYITEGMAMLSEGIHPAVIERAGQVAGMPMPPLGLADEVGLALMHQVGLQTKEDLGDAHTPNPASPILEKMVVGLDRTGKKSGSGFYAYDGDEKRLWPELAVHFPIRDAQPSLKEVVQRYLYAQAIEAARCMEEEVLLAAADADVGAIMGWGFAPYTGGPLCYIDTIGAGAFVECAEKLALAHGSRFSVPELLRSMAKEGRKFYEAQP
jgi:3-hydroxyacyl-CoA dehydrogenase / enoyl-CoA hydratase / 3-hydroxybutyryl-CoA epimerase